VSHIRGPRLNYRLKYWLSTGRLSVRAFIRLDEVSWGQRQRQAHMYEIAELHSFDRDLTVAA